MKVLDAATHRLLARLCLKSKAANVLTAYVRRTYKERCQTEEHRRIKLTEAAKRLHELRQDAVERYRSGAYSEEVFREQEQLIEAKLQRVILSRDGANTRRHDLPRVIFFIETKLSNLIELYGNATVEQKRLLIRGLFPDGLTWCYPGYANSGLNELGRVPSEARQGMISHRWINGDLFEQLLAWLENLEAQLRPSAD